MAFVIGQAVWFKRRGSTPFIAGDADNAALTYDSELGGRGNAAITLGDSVNKIGSVMGVPQIKTADFPAEIGSADTLPKTTVSGVALNLGVREQTVANPLAPHSVSTDGIFDASTPSALFNTGNQADGSIMDEGAVDRDGLTTALRTIDPNFPSGRPTGIVAEGRPGASSGSHEFDDESIDISSASKRVGRRTPSVEQQAGIVVQIVSVTAGTRSPDGTKIDSGKMYWVNWGPNNPSNPHKTKWYNKMKTTIHAEEDLVAD